MPSLSLRRKLKSSRHPPDSDDKASAKSAGSSRTPSFLRRTATTETTTSVNRSKEESPSYSNHSSSSSHKQQTPDPTDRAGTGSVASLLSKFRQSFEDLRDVATPRSPSLRGVTISSPESSARLASADTQLPLQISALNLNDIHSPLFPPPVSSPSVASPNFPSPGIEFSLVDSSGKSTPAHNARDAPDADPHFLSLDSPKDEPRDEVQNVSTSPELSRAPSDLSHNPSTSSSDGLPATVPTVPSTTSLPGIKFADSPDKDRERDKETTLSKFKRKTASIFSFDEPNELAAAPSEQLAIPQRIPMLRSQSSNSTTTTPQSPEQSSGQQTPTSDGTSTNHTVAPAPSLAMFTGTRPRSRTLGSISGDSNRSSSFSFGSFLSSKLRSDEPATTAQGVAGPPSARVTPSPRPPGSTAATPSSVSSASASVLTRASSMSDIQLPPRLDDETPEEYLIRLKTSCEHYQRSAVGLALSKSDSEFHRDVLQRYIDSSFDFIDDPLDIALRKFLMYVRLPRETQQIDRVLESFAKTYHSQNPGIYVDSEIAYVVVFSLMILHTDFFNKNNKHKMLKAEYIRNTYAKGVSKDVLECFYDNITYTPFIHTDDAEDAAKRGMAWKRSTSFVRSSKEMIDPYTLILENRLDVLRPSLAEVLNLDDPYDFFGLDSKDQFLDLRRQFAHGPYLQLVSERSRPEAFISSDKEGNMPSALSGGPGVVDIKVVKIGVIYRREPKRMYSKNNWREWGAILTASQLYLFKDVAWIKETMRESEEPDTLSIVEEVGDEPDVDEPTADFTSETDAAPAVHEANLAEEKPKVEVTRRPSGARPYHRIIKASIDGFHPSAVLSTVEMVALTSSTQDTHAMHCFLLGSRGGAQDWFAAESHAEMLDWMLKINFAASFNTYHVGIHGVSESIETNPLVRRRSQSLHTPGYTPEHMFRHHLSGSQEGSHHALRLAAVSQQMKEISRKLEQVEAELNEDIQAGSHLKLLAPIQQRTREAVIFAAGRLAARLDWHWLDRRRLLCYQDLFQMDQQVEVDLCGGSTALASEGHARREHGIAVDEESGRDDPVSQGVASDAGSLRSSVESVSIEGGRLKDITLTKSVVSVVSASGSTSGSIAGSVAGSVTASVTGSVAGSVAGSVVSSGSSPAVISDSSSLTRDKSLSVPKRMQRTLRDGKRQSSVHREGSSTPQRSTSLMRKANNGGDFTLHGKKFTVVEVNPDFAAPSHQRTASQSVPPPVAVDEGTVVERLPDNPEPAKLADETQTSEHLAEDSVEDAPYEDAQSQFSATQSPQKV